MRREIRQLTAEERNEAEVARREAEFIMSGDVSAIPKAKPDPMLVRHGKLAANDRRLQDASVSLRKMVQGLVRISKTLAQPSAAFRLAALLLHNIDGRATTSESFARCTCRVVFLFDGCLAHNRRPWSANGQRLGWGASPCASSLQRWVATWSRCVVAPFQLRGRPILSARLNVETAGSERPEI